MTYLFLIALFVYPLLSSPLFAQSGNVTISGELKKWHPVTLTLDGPSTSETGNPNPFLNKRFNVTFSKGSKSYPMMGYFAADGNAANTSATSGNKWRAHFVPDETGTWTYKISFREGTNVAINDSPTAGTANQFDGITGTFNVGGSDKSGKDFRARGVLRHVGEHYLRFDNGEWFMNNGTGSPESFLAAADFDNTFSQGTWIPKAYNSHVGDWNSGDPTWKSGKGKGIIGAINYLSNVGVNAMFMIVMNVQGDGKDTFPWTAHTDFYHFDVSKLAQWAIVFEHMNRKGIMPQLVLQEMGNDYLLDNGNLGTTRKLFYRELLARFGYLNGVKWNIGEEHRPVSKGGNTDAQRMAYVNYLVDHEPYDHPVVMHTSSGSGNYDALFGPFLGHDGFGGMSYHIHGPNNGGSDTGAGANTYKYARLWRERSAQNGRKWVITLDECCGWNTGVLPDQSNLVATRKDDMWGMLMAGTSGFNWYLGWGDDRRDLTLQDFRRYSFLWTTSTNATRFFEDHVPFIDLKPVDGLTPISTNRVLAKPGETYVIFLRNGGTTTLDLKSYSKDFDVFWYNPRTGGNLITGAVKKISGPGVKSLGSPPSDTGNDWAVLVRSAGSGNPATARFSASPSPTPFAIDFDGSASSSTAGSISSYAWTFGDGQSGSGKTVSHTYGSAGSYSVKLTVTDSQGNKDDVTQSVVVKDPNATGAFLEQNGLLVIEAENFEQNISRNGQQWTHSTSFSGYQGTGAMAALPDQGKIYNTGYGSNSPYMNFLADFTNTGTYYVWVRARAVSSGNTLHVGLDNQEIPSASALETFSFGGYVWMRQRKNGSNATLPINSGGQHNITIWVREDGIHIDRILLTTNAGYVPSGSGPAESPRGGGNPPPASDPVASFTASPNSGVVPLAVSFDASASTPPSGGTITNYAWDFGDGSNGSGKTINHTYNSAGSYTAKLTVTASNGNSDSQSKNITVSDQPPPAGDPTASFTASPNSGVAPLAVSFDASASSPPSGETITGYAWDFGDGGSGSGKTVNHTYGNPGSYTAKLTVTASNGNTDSQSKTITVSEQAPPPGDGDFIESNGMLVMEAEHYGQNVGRNGQKWALSTSFGGYQGSGSMAAHPDQGKIYNTGYASNSPYMNFPASFTKTGTYYVWVRARAVSSGNTLHVGLDNKEVSSASALETFNFSGYTWIGKRKNGSKATLSIGAAGHHDITVWMREDGIHVDRILLTTNAGFVPSGVGPAESSRGGGGDPPPAGDPTASFTASPNSGVAPLAVSFDASASSPPSGETITGYAWSFGDGSNGSGKTVNHTYNSPGNYTAKLTVTASNGKTASASKNITVSEQAPPPGDGDFIESNGLLVIEAEHYSQNASRNGQQWALSTSFGGYQGSGSMAAHPDQGKIYNTGYGSNSPYINFPASFTKTGTYYVWVRAHAVPSGNTLHVGLDNAEIPSASALETFNFSSYTWINKRKNGSTATLPINSAGHHDITLWMREDGIHVDRILLTTNSGYVPSGSGPAESQRSGSTTAMNRDVATATPVGLAGAEAAIAETPTEYAIGSYPNPFNPIATVSVDLPEDGWAAVKVYNVLGQLVSTLMDEHKTAGSYLVTFDGALLSSGLYVYTLETDQFRASKTMMLTK